MVGVGRGPAGLLIGAIVGSLVAARFETAFMCGLVSIGTAAVLGARRPSTGWLGAMVIGLSLTLILNLYLTAGRALPGPRLLGHAPTVEGLKNGALLALRMLGATAAVVGLIAAWPGERAVDELARLARPLERLGVPVGETRVVAGLALRFSPLLAEEARRIARAQDLRAGRPARGVRERLERRQATIIPTLVGALERAERVALALEARHYRVRPIPGGAALGSGWAITGLALAGTALLWR